MFYSRGGRQRGIWVGYFLSLNSADTDRAMRTLALASPYVAPIFCHTQHRNLDRLRRVNPDPVVEVNPTTTALGSSKTDGYRLLRRGGSVRAQAHQNPSIADGVVGGQYGWWQSCPDLGLPVTTRSGPMLQTSIVWIGDEVLDPISGAAPHRRLVVIRASFRAPPTPR
jgi:anaerobic selenocysteine-containing dehydrogenase